MNHARGPLPAGGSLSRGRDRCLNSFSKQSDKWHVVCWTLGAPGDTRAAWATVPGHLATELRCRSVLRVCGRKKLAGSRAREGANGDEAETVRSELGSADLRVYAAGGLCLILE